MINYFAISGLCIGFINLGLAILISLFGKTKLHTVWSFVNYSISLWGFGMFISGSTRDHEIAFMGWRIFNVGVILIAVIYYHVIYFFCKLRSKRFLIFSYFQGAIFISLVLFTNLIFGDRLVFSFGQFYYFRANILHHILMLSFFIIVGKSFFELYKYIRKSSGISNIQGKYLFLAMMFGFGGGLNTAPAAWGFNVYPYGQIFVCFYGAVATYAIFRYQLMDISVVVTRLGVLIFVYSLVLGIPFGLSIWGKPWLINVMGENWFWVPMTTLLVLATAGPFIFLFFQRKAEDVLLQEEKRIKDVLRAASAGINAVKDLGKLLGMIVNVLTKNLGVNSVAIYLFDGAENRFTLKVAEPKNNNEIILNNDSPLTLRLKSGKYPILAEEMNHLLENEKEESPGIKEIILKMRELSAAVVVPVLRDNDLLGFITLGERKDKKSYSKALTDNLSIVANEMALAIENAIFHEESGKDWTQRAHESRERTMGAMGTGIAHQIRNRFNAISAQCLLLQDLFAGFDSAKSTPQDVDKLRDEYNETMGRIFKDIEQGVEIVEAIKNYSKKTEAKSQVVAFEQPVSGAMRLLKLSRKNLNFTLVEDYPKGIMLWTNLSMLQDMFYNLFDNSNDAIISKQEQIQKGELESKDNDFKVSISAKPNGKMCAITIEDNGMGIKKSHLEEGEGVNVMYFTTKGATKGTGMGLALMRQFVKHNGGVMTIESEYTRWTKITITLPLATQEQIKNGGNV